MSAESTRALLLQLAANVVAGKPRAEQIADEICPWVASTDLCGPLFKALVAAVRAGDDEEQERLLSVLVGESVAA